MENGGLADKLSGLTVNDAKDNNLIQVMNAVEAAESIIKQQVEENNRLRADIQRKNQELEILRLDKAAAQRSHPHESYDENGQGIFKAYETASTSDPGAILFFHHGATPKSEDYVRQFPAESHSGIRRNSSILNSIPVGHTNPNDAGFTQLSSPSTAPFSPGRDPMNGDYGPGSNVPGQGMIRVAESNNSINLWKQGLVQKTRENEEEIMQLRKQLTDYLIKETQIRDEKLILEKRIAHMRMAFDQQQQDLVDAASKALSYRQEIIEENVHLTYQLEDAQQERATFVSSLLPLLAEYSMQPPNPDAQSIVSSVKVLFKHLQEKLIITEAKLKESQYQLAPWHSDGKNPSFAAQFPHHSGGAALSSSKKGLELVPQQAYSPVNVATEAQMATDWVIEGHHAHQGGAVTKGMELDDFGRYSPLAGRNTAAHDVSSQVDVSRDGLHMPQYHGEAINRHVKFKDPVTHSGMDKLNEEGRSNEGQNPGTRNWGSGASPYTNPLDEPSSYSPYLQTVPEEPSSSFSEAADDDPLPAVEGLQISGEAYPGQVLQASGYSINGTTCCNFEWVRHLEDGSINYIEGAKQPTYLVTADDVDTYLAIEVQPLDDRKRKGELVKVFANEHRKITTDPGMQSHIEKNLYTGYASYTISISTGYDDTWELATLIINREGYRISCREPNGDALNEKFSPATTVSVTPGHPSAFKISTSNGAVHLLRAEGIVPEISSLRDAIVLTLRWFVNKAGERKKGKKEKKRILFGYF